MDTSFSGSDYPEGVVSPPDSEPVNWYDLSLYALYLDEWKQRREYQSHLNPATSE